MTGPRDSDGDPINDEPALAGRSSYKDAPPLPADQNVLDEPALAVNETLRNTVVQGDAACPKCGYNRRSLALSVPCPECGNRATLRPDAGRANDISAEPAHSAPGSSIDYGIDMASASEELVRHSVFNEPHALPPDAGDAGPRPINADWFCAKCGYNLRGRLAGQACPECGHVQTSAPPPVQQVSYTNWLRAKIAATSEEKTWMITAVAAMLGGVWAVLAAMWNNSTVGGSMLFVAVIFAPVIEEIMKVALAAWIVEIKPYLFKHERQVRIAIIASGAMFGILENIYYSLVVLPAVGAPESMYLFRWIVCTALHITTTIVSSIGVAKVWREATVNLREPNLDSAYPWLIAAMVLHGLYNGGAVLFEIGRQAF